MLQETHNLLRIHYNANIFVIKTLWLVIMLGLYLSRGIRDKLVHLMATAMYPSINTCVLIKRTEENAMVGHQVKPMSKSANYTWDCIFLSAARVRPLPT